MAIQAMGEVNAGAEINVAKEMVASPGGCTGVGCCIGLRIEALEWQRLLDRCRGEFLPSIYVCTEPRWVMVNKLEMAPG